MRIQHNIAAMNSYRNFSANNTKLNKNLEKLSTGYKINRAGDDAAGLAISEKMRSQISGLDGATKNAKDGISLIQTAEGALTEVHDMLNRMTTLAEQSANGTYDDDVDRNQLQKEVEALKTEIDRIADSTNYNGLKLLDGSLGQGTDAKALQSAVKVSNLVAVDMKATHGSWTTGALLATDAAVDAGSTFTFSIGYTDNDGKEQTLTKTLKINATAASSVFTLVNDDGTEQAMTTKISSSASKIKVANAGAAIAEALGKDTAFSANFKVTADAGKLTFTAIQEGTDGAKLNKLDFTIAKKDGTVSAEDKDVAATLATNKPTDIAATYNLKDPKYVLNNSDSANITATKLNKAAFEIDGKKFVFLKEALSTNLTRGDALARLLSSEKIDGYVVASSGTPTAADVKNMVTLIEDKTGLDVEQGTVDTSNGPTKGTWTAGSSNAATDTSIFFKGVLAKAGKGGLTLQIGDTSDEYNKLTVSVEDMHSESIGIGDVDISDQEGAAEALTKIKDAVNYVSNTRGTLGALQNRLDHTINNLGVMKENIQSAESLIRDTDVAEEMMTYTKNNILNQSAQAMLAQANQLPQGVLQLLG